MFKDWIKVLIRLVHVSHHNKYHDLFGVQVTVWLNEIFKGSNQNKNRYNIHKV